MTGDRVEVFFVDEAGHATLYPATVDHVHADGHCDVEFDDGDYEERVHAERVKKIRDWVEKI